MTGQGRLYRNTCGLEVAHLAHHDDVRILADDGAQGPREGHADLGLDLDLIDARKLIFHRVLDRDDLALLGVEAAQRRVQGGALAAAGRTRDQEDPVGHVQDGTEPLAGTAVETESIEIEAHAFLVQKAHDHALAEHGGHGRHAKIQLLALHPQRDAPVLG